MGEADSLNDWNDIREAAVRLTMALYRVSERLPEAEPLRRRVRECADEILAGATAGNGDEEKKTGTIVKNIDALRNYLLVAGQMPWVAPINMHVLGREYTLLRDGLEQVILRESQEEKREEKKKQEEMLESIDVPVMTESAVKAEKKEHDSELEGARELGLPAGSPTTAPEETNPRQKKILEHIAGVGQARISDLFPVLDRVSSKTIQRDLSELVSRDILRKQGEKRWTTYSINGTCKNLSDKIKNVQYV